MSWPLWRKNGAFVKDRTELVFAADMQKETVDAVIDVCREYPEISNVLCGMECAYCQRGTVSQDEVLYSREQRARWICEHVNLTCDFQNNDGI